jgi:hypothetical protein
MSDSTYNGWTNYATWRVNLEMFDGTNLEDLTGRTDWENPYDLMDFLYAWAVEIIENDTPNGGLAQDYAIAFLDDVNWKEIAKHMINAYQAENA